MKKTSMSVLVALAFFGLFSHAYSQEYVSDVNLDSSGFFFNAANPLALPPVGASYLRILKDDLLELVYITPDTATWNFSASANRPASGDFDVKVNGVSVSVQTTVGFKRRPLYAPLGQYDLRIENNLYLKLNSTVSDGAAVQVTHTAVTTDWPSTLRFAALKNPTRYSPSIHVNQESYLAGTQYPKTAMVGYFLGDLEEVTGFPGEMNVPALGFDLIDTRSGQSVFHGTLASRGDIGWNTSPVEAKQYQKVMVADFHSWATPGEYILRVDQLGASFPFRIDDGTAMKLARTYALGLYHQRCGTANGPPFTRFVHDACHTAPVTIPKVNNQNNPFAANNLPTPDAVLFVENTLRGYSGAFDVQLVDLNSGALPTDGELTIVVGKYASGKLHFKVFVERDNNGHAVVAADMDDNNAGLAGKQTQIAALKTALTPLWSQISDGKIVITGDQKIARGADVRAILGGSLANKTGRAPEPIAPNKRLQTFSTILPLFQNINSGTINVSGGHHDAGDYSKYTVSSASFIHYLMFAVDNFPGVAALDNLGIPESNDQISDLMQEAKWEADFLIHMQDSDGGFYFLVYPAAREYETDVLPDHGDSQIVYPKTLTATAAAVAALAEIGSSPQYISKYGDTGASGGKRYRDAAQAGWNFLINATGTAYSGVTPAYQRITHYGDDFAGYDEVAWAAAAMFAATGNATYQNQLKTWFPDPHDATTWYFSWHRMYAGYGRAIRDYAFFTSSGRKQWLINQGVTVATIDSAYLAKCNTEISEWGATARGESQTNAYGSSLPFEDKSYYLAGWYFSGDSAYDIAVSHLIAPDAGDIPAIIENLNYELGRNPVNVSYVNGLGWKRQRETVNQYAQNDTRVLPPSGIPLGNVSDKFAEPGDSKWKYGQLEPMFFPSVPDPAIADKHTFAFYDRWADTYNLQQEFVSYQIARELGTAAYLAAATGHTGTPWRSADASIIVPGTTDPLSKAGIHFPTPVSLSATIDGQPLSSYNPKIVWELQGHEPSFGVFTANQVGKFSLEAEAVCPDGRRVFASVPSVLVYDPVHGGVNFTDPAGDNNVVALYHMDQTLNDEKHGLTLSAQGTSAFTLNPYSDNATWMKSPVGEVASFHNLGDQLTENIAASYFYQKPITMEFEFYPRAYFDPGSGYAFLFELIQGYNAYTAIQVSSGSTIPALFASTSTAVLDSTGWSAVFAPNTWHAVKITVGTDGTTTLFVDGHQIGVPKTPSLYNPNATGDWTLVIGNFDGDVDEVRISNILR